MLKRRGMRLPEISAWGLKLFSAVVVLLVNIGATVMEKGLIRVDSYTSEGLLEAMDRQPRLMTLAGAASVLRFLAGLALPIFALLLVEGFVHTGSYRKYLARMVALAVVSEFAFDYALTGAAFDLSRQNPALSLALCLVALYGLRLAERMAMVERVIISLFITFAAGFWTVVLRAQYGVEMLLLTSVLYCFREHLALKTVLGIVASLFEPLGPMAFCGVVFYNGRRELKAPGYVFYLLYPVQLLILGVITWNYLR